MKRIIMALLVLTATLPAAAQHMQIETNSGENEVIELKNLKQITFNGTNVNIEQTDGTLSSASMGSISRIYFGDFTDIEPTIARAESIIAYISGNTIAVNCKAGTTVTVYNMLGRQLLAERIGTEGGEINIAGLPQGIYILKADEKTAKFVKR